MIFFPQQPSEAMKDVSAELVPVLAPGRMPLHSIAQRHFQAIPDHVAGSKYFSQLIEGFGCRMFCFLIQVLGD
jgi:hypothetical protein